MKNFFCNQLLSNRLFLFIIILINISLPINNLYLFIAFSLSLILIFFNKINPNLKNLYFYIFILCLLTGLNFLIKNPKIEEAHSAFITDSDLKMISNFLPERLTKIMANDLSNNFDYDRYFEGRQAPANNKLFIKDPFAFSTDSFFQQNKFSRKLNNINASKRSHHRIGQFNTRSFAMPYDQELKENFPFYVFYKLNNEFSNSQICGKGNIYTSFSNSNDIHSLSFNSIGDQYKCVTLDGKNNFYIFAYSIGASDNFEIQLKKNNKIIFKQYLQFLIIILIILIILIKIIKIEFSTHLVLILISFLSSFLLAFLNDPNIIVGLRHVYGGSDGLIFNSFGSDIVENLKNGNYLESLKGGEDIFYFQPGMRYYVALFKIIFGETNYGYIFSISFFPYIIFLLSKLISTKRIAYTLFILFIFFPIFESIGFGHFNYVRQAVRLHAESLSIMLLIISIYLIFTEDKNKLNSNTNLILIGLMFSQIIFLRPNFLPTCFLLSLYLFYSNYLKGSLISKNLILIISLSPSLFCLFHNYFFGNELILFSSSASRHILLSNDFSEFNFIQAKNFMELIILQVRDWNDLIYFPRLLILIYVIYNIKFYRFNELIFCLIICCISQHIVLLLTHASSRYAYFAWLLTFILFIKVMYDNNHFFKFSDYFKKLVKKT
ncbi:MAG: hypothetical protein CFH18_00735 [Alphaproteobacteria bacterium MarineAlpha5_Bin8]|nr:MAG: hypothetical protein CFH17_01064 [Alphaproteobacteria bacterium MarineAlpha5_Bin7]PPR46005.1 MAG: hypothetical protein CFH18_00735 [Alphaproteobacteria bacterium MarineAlpha5_Bin8]PPR54276.1 MAG: hypothetical protein CFH16_00530 [Alphaproteobacteria bacterium MarineAlpha5_Bin6]|tara:strand:+ start:2481 stop:4469 length:1989 start_codon:yes stop_codon:yes gene_type:complete